MQYDRGLGRTKMGPREKTQTQFDDGSIERLNGLIQFERNRFFRVKLARAQYQSLCPIRINSPVAKFGGIGDRAAPDIAAKAHLIKQRGLLVQRRLLVAQTLSKGELSKRH